ncbi:MAG: hypothetical protein M3133_02285 [Actinomycetota bacterium]|nr:hypothetical protein [Actinomycetota bacterium]
MSLSWDGAENFLKREAERDHATGALPRPVLIAFQGEEPRVLGFCRHSRPGEPDLGMALVELAQLAQLVRPDRLLCAMPATLRPLATAPLSGREESARALAVQKLIRSGGRLRESARLLPYGLGDDGTPRWREPVDVAEAAPSDMRRTLRAVLLAAPARSYPDISEVAAVLAGWGHLIAVAPALLSEGVLSEDS